MEKCLENLRSLPTVCVKSKWVFICSFIYLFNYWSLNIPLTGTIFLILMTTLCFIVKKVKIHLFDDKFLE